MITDGWREGTAGWGTRAARGGVGDKNCLAQGECGEMRLGITPDMERPGGREGLLWAPGQRTVVGEGTGSGVH